MIVTPSIGRFDLAHHGLVGVFPGKKSRDRSKNGKDRGAQRHPRNPVLTTVLSAVMDFFVQIFQRNFSFFHEFNLRSTSTASRSKRNAKMKSNTDREPGLVRRFFALLGPGLVTGAADDDPSGVATYTIAGAQLGTSLLWTAFITWPLMGCVQFMCARIGMVTGRGLGGALRKKIPRWMLIIAAVALFGANSINVGSDLSGMADAAEMLTGLNSHWFVILFGVGISFWTIHCRYYQIAMILKWLALCLFAYVITAFVVRPDWSSILHDTFVPSWPKDHDTWQNLVAILGTTISPYLFFWQSSQEVEHEKAMGRRMLVERQNATSRQIIDRKLHLGVVTFFSNFVMYFIILAAAVTLHAHGVPKIETAKQAAEALRPLAGSLAYFLYTAALIALGLPALPTLTRSAAYTFPETFA